MTATRSERLSCGRFARGAITRNGWVRDVASVERVGGVPRQNRNVVIHRAPVGVYRRQIHGARQGCGQICATRSDRGADSAIANGRHVRSGCGVIYRLISFATLRPGAANRHHRHVAGMEVGAQSRRNPRWTVGWLGSARAILLTCGIDVEGAVLFDNPLVICDSHL